MIRNFTLFVIIINFVFFIVVNTDCYCGELNEPLEKRNVAMKKDNQYKYNVEKYKNISSAPSYVQIKFVSPETGEVLNMVIENEDMASYLAVKHGLKIDKLGRFKEAEAYKKFIETDYTKYMIANEGKVLDIDINDFKKFIGRVRFGNEKAGEKYLNSLIFRKYLTLKELNVNSETELIEKYFDFDASKGYGTLKKEYSKQYDSDPVFIALLIDLGYCVSRGDIVPILFIRK